MVNLGELGRLDGLDDTSDGLIVVVAINARLRRHLLVHVALLHKLREAAAIHLRLLWPGWHVALRLHVLAYGLILLHVLRLVAVDLHGVIALILASSDQLGIDVDFVTIV